MAAVDSPKLKSVQNSLNEGKSSEKLEDGKFSLEIEDEKLETQVSDGHTGLDERNDSEIRKDSYDEIIDSKVPDSSLKNSRNSSLKPERRGSERSVGFSQTVQNIVKQARAEADKTRKARLQKYKSKNYQVMSNFRRILRNELPVSVPKFQGRVIEL